MSEYLYRLLLYLYPASHRREYGEWMAQAFRDQCRAARQEGLWGWLALWWRTLMDVGKTALMEHLAAGKVELMDSPLVKNHPDRAASLLFLLPGIFLSLYAIVSGGGIEGYFLVGAVGAVGFILAWLKAVPPLRPWGQFVVGLAITGISYQMATIWSPMIDIGIPALAESPWPQVRLVVSVVVSLLIIGLLGWLVDSRLRRLYWTAAGVVLASGAVWTAVELLPFAGDLPGKYVWWRLTWSWGHGIAVLAAVILSLRLARRTGIQVLLSITVALGWLAALNLNLGSLYLMNFNGHLILLAVYLFPLVVCPAGLLLAPTWEQKKRGALWAWGILLLLIAGLYPSPAFLLNYVPVLTGLWLAFTLYEKQHTQPETATVSGQNGVVTA